MFIFVTCRGEENVVNIKPTNILCKGLVSRHISSFNVNSADVGGANATKRYPVEVVLRCKTTSAEYLRWKKIVTIEKI